MKNETTYRIVARTNGWIADRDINFNGKTEITLEKGMTLKEAQTELLRMFNEHFDTSYPNWGLVRCNHRLESNTHQDGTRSYEWDSRYYRIEDDEEA